MSQTSDTLAKMRWLEWLKSQVRRADGGDQKVPVGRFKDQQGGSSLGGPIVPPSPTKGRDKNAEAR
jgi:hypothetical protein